MMDVKRFLRKDHTLGNNWNDNNNAAISGTTSVNRSIGNNTNSIFSGVSSINTAAANNNTNNANNNNINNPSAIYPRSMNSNTLSDWASIS